MNTVGAIVILFALFTAADSGLLAGGICLAGCTAAYWTCVSVAGAATGGTGVPPAILACGAAKQVCMAGCVGAGIAPCP